MVTENAYVGEPYLAGNRAKAYVIRLYVDAKLTRTVLALPASFKSILSSCLGDAKKQIDVDLQHVQISDVFTSLGLKPYGPGINSYPGK
ncbi:hypothetical protein [Tellurirhabdus bombi]|uniref:hypothetical protein n=1 Tax=Tellurirhabdus bombi TaxID=2907205 RepID=UPI001F355A37|nr:hypothetical protein [Tellurirhabdus bombi]